MSPFVAQVKEMTLVIGRFNPNRIIKCWGNRFDTIAADQFCSKLQIFDRFLANF